MNRILFVALLIMISEFVIAGKSFCEGIKFSLNVYPKTIHYGDIIFSDARVENLTDTTLNVVQSISQGYTHEKYSLVAEGEYEPCLR
jgi:hypothetical protein